MKLLETLKRAARFESAIYEEIEQKDEYTNQAVSVIVLASIFSSVGVSGFDIFGIITALVLELISCAFWVAIIVAMAFKLLDIRIKPINFARCIGIALFPLILSILVLMPFVGNYLFAIAILLSIISVYKVVQQHLEIENALALVMSMIGSIPFILLNFYLIYQK